jgi:hypothetical protein
MRTLRVSLVILAAVLLSVPCTTLGRATPETQVYNTPVIYAEQDVPCANGGTGEDLYLTGTLHWVVHSVVDGKGGDHLQIKVHPQGVTGVGVTTGDVYRATGTTQHKYNWGKAAETYTWWHNNFRLIGPGPENNLHVKWRIRATFNANGEVTAYIDRTEVKCQ